MKRVWMCGLVVILILTTVGIMSLAGCKEETTEETSEQASVEETTEEKPAEEVTEDVEQAEAVTITLWTWQTGPAYAELYDYVEKTYEAENPNVDIEWEAMEYNSYNEKLKTAMAGGEAPDLFGVHPGSDSKQLADAGQILDITSKIKDDPDWSSWIEAALNYDELYVDGKIVFAPQSVNHLSVFYYRDMYPDGFPETLEEMYAESDRLNAEGIVPITVGWADQWSLIDTFIIYQYQLDPDKELLGKADRGETSWENDTFANSMAIVKEMLDKGVWPEDAISLGYAAQALEMFTSKKAAAMWPLGEWYLASMNKEDLDSDNIGSAALPKIDSDKESIITGGVAATLAVNAKSENLDIAIDVLKMTNSPGAQEILFDNLATPPGKVDKESDIALFTEVANRQATFPITYRYINTPEINQAVGENLQLLLLGTPIDECLANIQAVVDSIYSE